MKLPAHFLKFYFFSQNSAKYLALKVSLTQTWAITVKEPAWNHAKLIHLKKWNYYYKYKSQGGCIPANKISQGAKDIWNNTLVLDFKKVTAQYRGKHMVFQPDHVGFNLELQVIGWVTWQIAYYFCVSVSSMAKWRWQ